MDPFTLALMGISFLNNQDQKRRQGILDETEAKWSGFKNYKPFDASSSVKNPVGELTQAIGWQRALQQAKERETPRVKETDETLAAKELNGQSLPDTRNYYLKMLGL